VKCWRGLATNVHQSIGRGDAVVVHGRVRVDVWEREDKSTAVSWIVDATFVGHDLNRGTSRFAKTTRAVREPGETDGPRPETTTAPAQPQADPTAA